MAEPIPAEDIDDVMKADVSLKQVYTASWRPGRGSISRSDAAGPYGSREGRVL